MEFFKIVKKFIGRSNLQEWKIKYFFRRIKLVILTQKNREKAVAISDIKTYSKAVTFNTV